MSGIVLELQQDILNANCDILNILRKAHFIAKKLSLDEFDAWIVSELNGYKDVSTIPDYRTVRGRLKAKGYQDVLFLDNEMEKNICEKKLKDSIGEIIDLINESEGVVDCYYSAEMNNKLNSYYETETKYVLQVSTHLLRAIVEKVKNALLEWTFRLEREGIIGEGIQFNSTEINSAKRMPQNVYNYYGNTNVINGNVKESAVISGDNNTVEFTYERAEEAITEIETSLKQEKLSPDDREAAEEMIAEIKDKTTKKKKPSVIKAAFGAMKEFLIGVSASATVAIIQAKMQGLF